MKEKYKVGLVFAFCWFLGGVRRGVLVFWVNLEAVFVFPEGAEASAVAPGARAGPQPFPPTRRLRRRPLGSAVNSGI